MKSKRKWRGEVQYLASWKGYGDSEDKWLPLDQLGNCKSHIAEFEKELAQVEEGWQAAQRKAAAKGASGSGSDKETTVPLSEYEQERARRMSRNEKVISDLGILEHKAHLASNNSSGSDSDVPVGDQRSPAPVEEASSHMYACCSIYMHAFNHNNDANNHLMCHAGPYYSTKSDNYSYCCPLCTSVV